MKNQILIIVQLILSILLFTSCGFRQYHGTSQNVMKFKRAGDANFSFSLDNDGKETYSAGIALTDHIGFISDYKSFNNYSVGSNKKKHLDYFWDNELIIYDHSKKNKLIYAVNLGYGCGTIAKGIKEENLAKYNYTNYLLFVDRLFVQPSVGYTSKYFEGAFSTRFSKVNYKLENGYEEYLEEFNIANLGNTNYYFIEPAFSIALKYEMVKLEFQHIEIIGDKTYINYMNNNNLIKLSVNLNVVDLFM